MGADIYIVSKSKPNAKIVKWWEKSFCYGPTKKGKAYIYYWRDSYNRTNLAWVINLSYWKQFESDPKEFLKKLSKITDKEIETYVKSLNLDFKDREWLIKLLKKKRDYIKHVMKGFVKIHYLSI